MNVILLIISVYGGVKDIPMRTMEECTVALQQIAITKVNFHPQAYCIWNG